jgi:hypothetical protein
MKIKCDFLIKVSNIICFYTWINCTLVQALRLCTDPTAHRWSRGIALLFYDHTTRREWGGQHHALACIINIALKADTAIGKMKTT